jgi:hypothetical protein
MKKNELKKVLFQEMEKYKNKSYEELIGLVEPIVYSQGSGNNFYQVEVQILEKNDEYVHVSVAVDDGGLLRSISPLSKSFIVHKSGRAA